MSGTSHIDRYLNSVKIASGISIMIKALPFDNSSKERYREDCPTYTLLGTNAQRAIDLSRGKIGPPMLHNLAPGNPHRHHDHDSQILSPTNQLALAGSKDSKP
jgi:hypothetical protein